MTKNTQTEWTLIESRDINPSPYDECLLAIVEHDGQRYLLSQLRAHEAMRSYWGLAARIKPEDTLDTLAAPLNEYTSVREAVLAGYDDDRPLLWWTDGRVAQVAEKAGL